MSYISFEKGIFVAHFDYHNRMIPKEAGFWFHGEPNTDKCYKGCKACKAGIRKKWWTPFLEKAILLENYADTSAKSEIEKYQKNLDASRSAASETSYPCPPNLDYYPFQKACIDYCLDKHAVLIADEMGCIDGSSIIQFNRGGKGFKMNLEKAYRRFNGLDKENYNWDKSIPTKCTALCDGELRLHEVKKIIDKDVRETLEIITESLKCIVLTPDHEVARDVKGKKWTEAGLLKCGDEIVTNGIPTCIKCGSTENVSISEYAKYRGYCKKCIYRYLRKNTIKEGKFIDNDGYVRVSGQFDHPRQCANNQVYEHILVMEKMIGRHVRIDEDIYHKNGDPSDNREENLELVNRSEHHRYHKKHLNLQNNEKVRFIPKLDRIVSIEKKGKRHVYDIVMVDPYRNFVANGIVVHNCGKTIETLGVVNADSNIKSVLVVCPASLRLNWLREAQRWLVGGDWHYYVVETNSPVPQESNFVIVNYDRLKGDVFKSLMLREWDLLIADESHKVKNPNAQRTQSVLGIPVKWGKGDDGKWVIDEPRTPGLVDQCSRKFFLTGTPILNRPIELFPLLHAIEPDKWRSRFKFAKRYCDGGYTKHGFNDKGSSNEEELQLKLRSSCMIRRLKSEVLTELPPKRRQVIILPPNGAKTSIKEEQRVWKKHEERLEALQEAVIFTKISEDKKAYEKAVKDLKEGFGVAFSEISKARKKVALAKVPATVEHVNNMLESGVNKIIVWAHHHEVLDKLQEKFGNVSIKVDGRTSLRKRDEAVQAFQAVDELKIILCGMHAMGEGHTLTASSHAVFVELDFTPARMQQCEDRCHRVTQTESVLVQHLVYDETIDVSLANMLVEKQAIIDAALDDKYEAIDVPLIPSPRRTYRKFSKVEREAITEAVRLLAGFCDGARQLDGMGFNRIDTEFGKRLARKSYERQLSSGELTVAEKFAIKYQGQLPSELLNVICPSPKSN